MIDSLVSLIIYLLVAGILVALVVYVVDAIPVPEPFNRLIKIVVFVVAALICIYALLGLIGAAPRLRVGADTCQSIANAISTPCANSRSAAS
jgi:hypothetical protein